MFDERTMRDSQYYYTAPAAVTPPTPLRGRTRLTPRTTYRNVRQDIHFAERQP